MTVILYFLPLQYASVAFLIKSWSLFLHPLNLTWPVICFGQQNVVNRWLSPEPRPQEALRDSFLSRNLSSAVRTSLG